MTKQQIEQMFDSLEHSYNLISEVQDSVENDTLFTYCSKAMKEMRKVMDLLKKEL